MEVNEILEAYLFETKELLEALDEILLNSEKAEEIDTDSINGIFRIMHTVKGSSAMMEFDSMATVSHRIEDLFAYVRENGFDSNFNNEMFELLFKASDFLKSELEEIENGGELTDNITDLTDEIKRMLDLVSGNSTETTKAGEPSQPVVAPSKQETAPCHNSVKVFFDSEAKMENLRAFMLVEKLLKECGTITTTPENPQDSTPEEIAQNGLIINFLSREDLSVGIAIINNFGFISSHEVVETAVEPTTEIDVSHASGVKVFFDSEAKMENLRAFMLVEKLSEQFKNFTTNPADPQNASAEELAKNGFEIKFTSAEELAKAVAIIQGSGFVQSIVPIETEKQAKEPTEKKATKENDSHKKGSSSSLINVNLSKLDDLIDLMGEIVINSSIVTSISDVKNLDFDKFQKDARQLQKLTNELQENIMSLRMMPISNIFNKMHRIVRDMSKKLGKQAELIVVGEDTEVDKAIIDCIGDPIMHIVRNAMDHGIEMPDAREASGKSPKGTVRMTAQNTVGEIIITISDDGKGFKKSGILQKAKDKGLLKKPESEYTEKEIYNMLLMPGFSTKSEVTEFSGRGVGLDVVKSSIEKIGGTVTLSSEEGKGSTVSITIPLTLAIIEAMKVKVGESIFSIPIHNIKQTFKPTPENIVTDAHGKEMVLIRNECYPIIRLGSDYNIPHKYDDLCDGIVILVETHNSSYCIFADSLIGEQQIVIKPLPTYFANYNLKNHGISGCAILGDGSISLIIDAATLTNIKEIY